MNAHWSSIALADIFEIARGGSPRPIERFITDSPDGLNWVKIGDATEGDGKFITRTRQKILPEGLSKTRRVHAGDFLLTNSMSFGRPYIMATDGCIHDGWLLLRPRNEELVDRGYFYHLLSSDFMFAQFSARAAGSTVKNLNTEIVSSVQVKLPPLDEQRRIAAILDKADALRQKRKRAIAMLDSLTQSIFLEMFGDPVTNPKDLSKQALQDLIRVKSGDGLTGAQMDQSGTYLVYGGNGPNGRHSQYMFDEPVVTIGRVGVYCGAVHITEPKSWVTDNSLYVADHTDALDLDYLAAALKIADLNQYAGRAAQPLISGGRIYPVEILVPPIALQHQYSTAITQLRNIKNTSAPDRLDGLFTSLQHRAFSGQL